MNINVCFIALLIVVANEIKGDNQGRCKRQTTNTCFLMPQGEEGPYYWNATYNRPNVTEDRQGIPFTLHINVIEVGTCEPIANAAVDIWHCDAAGIYSHFVNASLGGGGGPPPGMNGTGPPGMNGTGPPGMNGTRPPGPPGGGNRITDNTTFLRGLQVTDNNGKATFFTIYPGWYNGRATHIHLKVHINGTYVTDSGVYTGGHVSHTGQLFFNDSLTDQVALLSPYVSRNITRVLNTVDGIYNRQGGSFSLLSVNLIQADSGLQGGVIASITLGINSSSIPAPVGGGGGPISPNPDLSTSTLRSKGNSFTTMNFVLVFFSILLIAA